MNLTISLVLSSESDLSLRETTTFFDVVCVWPHNLSPTHEPSGLNESIFFTHLSIALL